MRVCVAPQTRVSRDNLHRPPAHHNRLPSPAGFPGVLRQSHGPDGTSPIRLRVRRVESVTMHLFDTTGALPTIVSLGKVVCARPDVFILIEGRMANGTRTDQGLTFSAIGQRPIGHAGASMRLTPGFGEVASAALSKASDRVPRVVRNPCPGDGAGRTGCGQPGAPARRTNPIPAAGGAPNEPNPGRWPVRRTNPIAAHGPCAERTQSPPQPTRRVPRVVRNPCPGDGLGRTGCGQPGAPGHRPGTEHPETRREPLVIDLHRRGRSAPSRQENPGPPGPGRRLVRVRTESRQGVSSPKPPPECLRKVTPERGHKPVELHDLENSAQANPTRLGAAICAGHVVVIGRRFG
jgi:hypothetical protein